MAGVRVGTQGRAKRQAQALHCSQNLQQQGNLSLPYSWDADDCAAWAVAACWPAAYWELRMRVVLWV